VSGSPTSSGLVADAYSDALRLLAGRELSVAECRQRLLDREHSPEEAERAIARLLETGALDDDRVAHTYARMAANIKGRGRVRVTRELQQKGIARNVVAAAVADVFGELDERSLVARAIQKKLRRGSKPADTAAYARLYQYLMRQGFSPAAVTAELRRLEGGPRNDHE
jgi:regulatory protein